MSCQRRRAVPLRPIWAIMAAAKLDHSRVLVTKFHQNRSMLKGRSAGQRHTDRQTGANFKIYLLRQFCLNESKFFYNTQETQTQKWWTRIWNSNSVIFENFLKFSKRCRAVPLRPIWTIMVVGKLYHIRVLVTKFHQNRSTLKGRSAGQRQTDRQTRLKIMALQVLQSGQKK